MELVPGIVAVEGALFLEESKTLVLADLHFGYEEERRNVGVLLPTGQRQIVRDAVEGLLARLSPDRVVLLGDVKHEFGRISQQEWDQVRTFIRWLQERCDVEVVLGNHDNLLVPILKRLEIEPRRFLLLETVLLVHGDVTIGDLVEHHGLSKERLRSCSTIVMGHEHPAMTITDGIRSETMKCYLVGKLAVLRKKRDLVVLPSYNPLTWGTDVLRERPLGPLLTTVGGFSAFALVDGKVLAFGLVEKLQRQQRA